ncbi:HAD family hydrolase [Rathayibacter sp. YIM 133350]|uniref:HAD family hydrolase n=1 Tax=Rathayibacter sp. YIM 133350 TaxID=3131992 RepID=UPI00307F4B36
MTDTPVSAALFDIDGTLADSNYLHVEAWHHAFEDMGVRVDAWRIHRGIGQDSARLLSSLVGDRDDEWLEQAKDLHSTYYKQLTSRLYPFTDAAGLLQALADRGVHVVLATSAPDDELEILLKALDADAAIHATTSADDVDAAKPEPDIVAVALDKAGATAQNAVFIGDSVWDMKAAVAAGVRPFGVRSGGVSEAELVDAGAVRVFDDPAALLGNLDALDLG